MCAGQTAQHYEAGLFGKISTGNVHFQNLKYSLTRFVSMKLVPFWRGALFKYEIPCELPPNQWHTAVANWRLLNEVAGGFQVCECWWHCLEAR